MYIFAIGAVRNDESIALQTTFSAHAFPHNAEWIQLYFRPTRRGKVQM